MNGENRARFVEAMRSFKEWAVRVAAARDSPDMVMPVRIHNNNRFVFSLEAYNYFAEHYKQKLRHFKSEKQLAEQINHYKKVLYKGGGAVLLKKSRFFLLPNRP
ncbi:MAG: hypothetical protein KGH65_00780 [Candidatus Micrarchaeota archaeon]|nr:hypothetical protein [Candidatus Micrarchaeota archaeon]